MAADVKTVNTANYRLSAMMMALAAALTVLIIFTILGNLLDN